MEFVALLDSLTEFPEILDGAVMKLLGLPDTETGFTVEIVMELVTLMDSVTEFPDLLDGTVVNA